MAKELEIIWDQKPPKAVAPTAHISARVIVLSESAAAPIKDAKTVCLGYSKDKKTIFVKAYHADKDQQLIQYPVKVGDRSHSIKCGKFIEGLGLSIEPRKRIKCSASVEDTMVVISL